MVFRGNYGGDDKDELIHVGFYRVKSGFRGSQYGQLDDDIFPNNNVTHWMPLPDAPEGE